MPLTVARLIQGVCDQFCWSSEHTSVSSACPKLSDLARNQRGEPKHVRLGHQRLMLPFAGRLDDACFDIREPAEVTFAECLHPLQRPSAENVNAFSPMFLGKSPGGETLAAWFSALGRLNRSVAGTSSFYHDAAMMSIDPGGLDAGLVLVLHPDGWRSAACAVRADNLGFAYEPVVLQRMLDEGVALFHSSVDGSALSLSESVVCAPVFGIDNEIVAAVYAIRSHRSSNQRRGVRPLEALWIQLLAESLTSAGIRLMREAEAARTQVLLAQAFPPEVTQDLLTDPSALDGQTRVITTLFADLRKSSSISEALSPHELCELLRAVLTEITEAAMSLGGVVVDYHGDGMAAMWNAPQDQPDHASRACAAAIEMVQRIDLLSNCWEQRLGDGLKLVIGIHTGEAIVGNTGTEHRFKYGPRGMAINTTSRLESAAKVLEIPILASATTHSLLPEGEFLTRRAATVRLRGIPDPVELFEVHAPSVDVDQVEHRIQAFERVLSLMERGQMQQAEDQLNKILQTDRTIQIPRDLRLLSAQIDSGMPDNAPVAMTLDLAGY